ncbi:hypothetical protein [Galbibacter sp.]|uniref:hypothetical protein n=1 Tax=Galbibacter sp. TaxID=2918471 RepID=UPI003A9197F6
MKNLKLVSILILTTLFSFTSCQDEVDVENGQNPNTNTANSQTANNLERSAMHDGSFDDFLDDTSCSSIVLPVVATVNGTEISIVSQAQYELVLEILAELNDDDDLITFQFPITVMTSNYTEITVASQAEYQAIMDACDDLENDGEDAISCIDIDFPITILTYSASLEQTGSVVIQSKMELYAYMDDFGDDEFFAIDYPITATVNGDTTVTLHSDADLKGSITECIGVEEMEDDAEDDAEELEDALVQSSFKVASFINAGVEKSADYAEYTIDFANDYSLTAINTAIGTVEGTYKVASATEVFLELNFSGNATFSVLSQQWKVVDFDDDDSSIVLQSTTNAEVTLTLNKI